jgi:hypothetical protein
MKRLPLMYDYQYGFEYAYAIQNSHWLPNTHKINILSRVSILEILYPLDFGRHRFQFIMGIRPAEFLDLFKWCYYTLLTFGDDVSGQHELISLNAARNT